MNQQQEKEMEKEKEKKQKEFFFRFLTMVALGIYIWVKVFQTDRNACSGSTWSWMAYAGAYFFIAAIDNLLDFMRELGYETPFTRFLPLVLKPFLDIGLFILFIGSMISYANIDDCSDLKDVIKLLFALMFICIGLPILFLCCFLCSIFISKKPNSAGGVMNGLKPSNNPGVRMLFRSSSLKSNTNKPNEPNKEIQLSNQDHVRLSEANQEPEDRL